MTNTRNLTVYFYFFYFINFVNKVALSYRDNIA